MKLQRKSSERVRSICRMLAGSYGARPVEVVEGDSAPRLVGDGPHYRNKSGHKIRHPTAYGKKGWRSMVYHGSDRRVEVGLEWLCANLPALMLVPRKQHQQDAAWDEVRGFYLAGEFHITPDRDIAFVGHDFTQRFTCWNTIYAFHGGPLDGQFLRLGFGR